MTGLYSGAWARTLFGSSNKYLRVPVGFCIVLYDLFVSQGLVYAVIGLIALLRPLVKFFVENNTFGLNPPPLCSSDTFIMSPYGIFSPIIKLSF